MIFFFKLQHLQSWSRRCVYKSIFEETKMFADIKFDLQISAAPERILYYVYKHPR